MHILTCDSDVEINRCGIGGAVIIMAAGVNITDDGRIAVLRMQCKDNRFTPEFINTYKDYKFERDVWPDEGRPTAYEFKTTYQC